jgi:DHA1 family bicyclomycin/chloramphenicol resistance-like MFS transporter
MQADRSPPRLLTLVAIAGLAALTMNIFLPSLTSISAWYGADYALAQLAISAYLAATAVLQIIIGPLSDRFGRRPVMLGGIVIFILASIGCLIAPGIYSFLAFRMIQATIATGMVLSRAIIRDMVEPSEAASMIGYVTMGMSLAPMIGPAIGGWLDHLIGWQASFIILLVCGFGVLALVWVDLGETNRHPTPSFAAQFRAYPELIRSRRFWGYTLTATFSAGVFFSFLGGAPFVAETLFGLTPASSGMYFALVSIGYMFGNFLSGRFSQSIGFNQMMIYGATTSIVGVIISLGLFSSGIIHPLSLYLPMLVVAVGNGLTLPNANAGIVSVRPQLAGSASGLGGAVNIAGGAGIAAITGAMMSDGTGIWPLLGMMGLSSLFAILSANIVMRLAPRG